MKREPRIPVSWSLPGKDRWILESLDEKARMERVRGGRSALIKQAVLEYFQHHGGENPQTRLKDEGPTPPLNLQEAGIRRLRIVSGLSYERIAQITGFSFRQVRQICQDSKPKITPRRKGFSLAVYQEAWRKFLAGVKFEEAFRVGGSKVGMYQGRDTFER